MVLYHRTSEPSIYRPINGNNKKHPLIDWNLVCCQNKYLRQWQDIWMWIVGSGKLIIATESIWCVSDPSGTSRIMEWFPRGDICHSSTWLEGGLHLQMFYSYLSWSYHEQAKLSWKSMQGTKSDWHTQLWEKSAFQVIKKCIAKMSIYFHYLCELETQQIMDLILQNPLINVCLLLPLYILIKAFV